MFKPVFLSDFFSNEVPTGGAELVDEVVIDYFNCDTMKSSSFAKDFRKDKFYIVSNISLLKNSEIKLLQEANYIILEHDYKFVESRHPWKFNGSIVPKDQVINRDLYKNAKAVFVQTTDHLEVFKLNEIEGNFINLECSLWSDSDLDLLDEVRNEVELDNRSFGIYDSNNWIKNTAGAVNWCKNNSINYQLLPNAISREQFLRHMAHCAGLVFFPIARETCCRLVVEARCLEMNVITPKTYGAVLEPWFSLSGLELTSFLREMSEKNLKTIAKYVKS